jgi:hypothetical protein
MPSSKIEKYLKNNRKSQFTNKTYSDFRNDLLGYANEFYENNIVDFSESSLGGMFLDFASIVGDSLMFYAEQQFNELDYESAVDFDNINKHLRNANIKNPTASPSSVSVTFSVTIDAEHDSTLKAFTPIIKQMPTLKSGTVLTSNSGVFFSLIEDVDFSKGYTKQIIDTNASGDPSKFMITKKGICVSGEIVTEVVSFPLANTEGHYLSYELENENVTKIINIVDNENNKYYEVDFLTQSTIYERVENSNDSAYMMIKPAPFRFIKQNNYANGKTTIRFGSGEGKLTKDNIFTNTEDLLLPIKNRSYIGRIDLDPGSLLKSNSLGVSPRGKNVSITYKFGGGVEHNIEERTITSFVGKPIVTFPNITSVLNINTKNKIIESLVPNNEEAAIGGEPPEGLDTLKLQIPAALRMQSRIINHEDLIARILSMPTDFGKINKAVALENKNSSASKDLFVICKDSNRFYTNASDAIKTNLSSYINEYRLIGDNFNILDVPVFNFGIEIKIKTKKYHDINNVLNEVAIRLVENLRFDSLQIGEAINTNLIYSIINDTDGVASITTNQQNFIISKSSEDNFIDNITNQLKVYQENRFSPISSYKDGFVYPSRGAIFEMRYTAKDIQIVAG